MTDTTNSLTDRLGSYTARDALNLLSTLLLVAIVIPFVIYAVPQVVGAEQSYVVMSGSMEPTIGTGDVIIVNEVPTSQIEEGDVITFGGSAAEPPTTHRVIAVEESNGERVFRTQGDNNEDPDPSPVAASEVRGQVMELPVSVPGADHSLFVIPFIGRVVLFAQTTTGLVALILAPFVLLAGSELLTFTKGFREEDGSSEGDEQTADATDRVPEAREPTDDPTPDDADGFTLSIRVLTIAVAVLASAGTFAAQRAYETREPLMATVAVGSIVGCLLVVFMILFGGESESAADRTTEARATEQLRTDGSTAAVSGSTVPTDHVVAGRPSSTLREWPETEVDSPETLSEMATEGGRCVIRDVETGVLVLFEDGVAYTAHPSETDAEDDDPPAPATGRSDAPGEPRDEGALPDDGATGASSTSTSDPRSGGDTTDAPSDAEAGREVDQ